MSDTASKLIPGRTGEWEVVLGLEVHAQVASNSKLFSGAAVGFGAGPNEQVSLVDAAFPGMLPVINRYCVEQAVRAGRGLNAKINPWSRFDRKNYFYPDLPQGYQISQFAHPIVGEGEIEVERDDGSSFTVRIERLHLEQDAGKSIHDLDPNATYVDLNRAGTALMEIVSRPDMRTSADAAAYVRKLRTILRYIGACDGDMEKGNLRADVNVSVCRPGAYDKFRETGDFSHLGTRCEIKNVNSYRFIQQAIEYEARRQVEILEDGGSITQETRLFDPGKGETRSMRSKEEAHDYRYFPDPDLLPLELDPEWIKRIEASLVELPDTKKARFIREFLLTPYQARALTSERDIADAFERKVHQFLTEEWGELNYAAYRAASGWSLPNDFFSIYPSLSNPAALPQDPAALDGVVEGATQSIANLILGGVFAGAAAAGEDAAPHIDRLELGALYRLIREDVISSKIAKEVFERMWAGEGAPEHIVKIHGLMQVSDTGAIEGIIDRLIEANPAQAEAVKAKPQAVGWFVGQVMKETGGKANPGAVNQLLKTKLGL